MRVPVAVAGSGYDVVLTQGWDGLGQELGGLFAPGRCVVVTNTVVGPLHAKDVVAALSGAGWSPVVIEIPDGESEKTLTTWETLVSGLLDARVDRRTPVLALGGGVTGDIVGFAAATALRGVPFVQLPTTLLAMVDASVGGKTGVNTRQGKNLVGAFHQPRLVWAAMETLRTLPGEELRCGLGEVVKHAVIEGEEALRLCEARAEALAAGQPGALEELVERSVRTKAEIVAADPLEAGQRAILNLGHTLGHAIESVAGYGALRHGEAVMIGMCGIARFARAAGLLEASELPERLDRLGARLRLPVRPPGAWDPQALVEAVGFDKKRLRAKIRIVVPRAPGDVVLHDLPVDEVPALVRALSPDL